MLAGRRFQFRPILTFFAVLGFGVLLSLGKWQLDRLDWKRDLIAQVDARIGAAAVPIEDALSRAGAGENMEYTPVTAFGVFDFSNDAAVFGARGGAPGAFMFAPFRMTNGGVIYVNTGFIEQGVANDRWLGYLGEAAVIRGLFRNPERPGAPARWFRSTKKSADGYWLLRDPALFAKDAGVDAPEFYIDMFTPEGEIATRTRFRNKHQEYALTWFGLAATLFGVWLAFSLPKRQ